MLENFYKKLARKVNISSRDVKKIEQYSSSEQGFDIVYVFRRKSLFELRLWNQVCSQLGFKKGEVLYLRSRLGYELSLSSVAKHREYFKEELRIRLNKSKSKSDAVSNDVVFIPVSFLAGKGPSLFYFNYLPDFDIFPISEVFNFFQFLFEKKNLSAKVGSAIKKARDENSLYRKISLALYKHEKAVKSSQSDVEKIIAEPKIEEHINKVSMQTGASRQQLKAQVKSCYDEIAAKISPISVKIIYFIVRPVMRAVFKKVNVNGIEELKEAINKAPTVIVPSHRSHFDYLLIGWIFYHAKLPMPYVAAGANLNFFPVGRFIKSAGGFFIRRKTGADYLYKLVLTSYLKYLVKVGHVIAFYIEGGRSRSGSMLNPKLGILKYIVATWQSGQREDIYFVPVSIAYEKVAEENALTKELRGVKKKSESIFELFKLGNIWKKKFGEVTINISSPISLDKFQEKTQAEKEKSSIDLNLLTEDLGYEISRTVMSNTIVTLKTITALSLLSFKNYQIDLSEFEKRIKDFKDLFIEKELLSDFIARKNKEFSFSDFYTLDGQVLRANLEKLALIDYYKNNILHHLLPYAILSLSFEKKVLSRKKVHFYHQLFKPYFLLNHWSSWEKDLELVFKKLANNGVVKKEANTIKLIDTKYFEKFKYLLTPFFDSISIVDNVVSNSLILNSSSEGLKIEEAYSDIISMQDARYRVESYSKSYLKFANNSLKIAKDLQSDTGVNFRDVLDLST